MDGHSFPVTHAQPPHRQLPPPAGGWLLQLPAFAVVGALTRRFLIGTYHLGFQQALPGLSHAKTDSSLPEVCPLSEKLGTAMLQAQVEFQKSNPGISGRSAEAPSTHKQLTGLHSALLRGVDNP